MLFNNIKKQKKIWIIIASIFVLLGLIISIIFLFKNNTKKLDNINYDKEEDFVYLEDEISDIKTDEDFKEKFKNHIEYTDENGKRIESVVKIYNEDANVTYYNDTFINIKIPERLNHFQYIDDENGNVIYSLMDEKETKNKIKEDYEKIKEIINSGENKTLLMNTVTFDGITTPHELDELPELIEKMLWQNMEVKNTDTISHIEITVLNENINTTIRIMSTMSFGYTIDINYTPKTETSLEKN